MSCTGAYYQNVLPEADAFKMLERHPAEVRKNGGFDYMSNLHRAKNLEYIARIHSGTPFHLYLRDGKSVSGPDLKGLHLRTAPIYRNFFQSLGATTQRSNIQQVYSYMENGTVDSFGWPVTGLLPDWHKVTAYRVDPGFYDADIHLLVNRDAWQKMSAEQQAILQKVGVAWKNKGHDMDVRDAKSAKGAQADKGIKVIEFTGAARTKWLNDTRESGWAGIVEVSPEHGPKLRQFFAK